MRTIGALALAASVSAAGAGVALAADTDPKPAPPLSTGVRFELPGAADPLTIAGLGAYRGALEVRASGGSLVVVNEVALEDYVRGVYEMSPGWPAAALQAQAIAARTYALHRAVNPDSSPWRAAGADICATDSCQVYRGVATEQQAQGAAWVAAVAATAGQALLASNRPIGASYSAMGGGPSAMSQTGAYSMAIQGRGPADILAAYYDGVRPSPVPPGRLPATIRVALSLGSASVTVSGPRPIVARDAGGHELATAPGEWRVVPAAGGLQVIPPAGEAPPPVPSAADTRVAGAPARGPARAGRVLLAGPGPAAGGGWAQAALALVLAAGSGAVTIHRRHICPRG